jgi:hypothetical protein
LNFRKPRPARRTAAAPNIKIILFAIYLPLSGLLRNENCGSIRPSDPATR